MRSTSSGARRCVNASSRSSRRSGWALFCKACVTQEQLAERCGTNKHYISRIENDTSDIRLSTLLRIIRDGLGARLRFSVE